MAETTSIGQDDNRADAETQLGSEKPYDGHDVNYEPPIDIIQPTYNDVWAGFFMAALLCGIIGLSSITLQGYPYLGWIQGGLKLDPNRQCSSQNVDANLGRQAIMIFTIVILVSFVLGCAYVVLAHFITRAVIWITWLSAACLALVNGVLGLAFSLCQQDATCKKILDNMTCRSGLFPSNQYTGSYTSTWPTLLHNGHASRLRDWLADRIGSMRDTLLWLRTYLQNSTGWPSDPKNTMKLLLDHLPIRPSRVAHSNSTWTNTVRPLSFLSFALSLSALLYVFLCRKRISFSALMLNTSIKVSRKVGHVYTVSATGAVIGAALLLWFTDTLVSVYEKYDPSNRHGDCVEGKNGCSKAKAVGLIVFMAIAMWWILELLKNSVYTIIAGIYGTWYFFPDTPDMSVTRGSIERALTYNLGSISLGSLCFVGLLQFFRETFAIAQSSLDAAKAVPRALSRVLGAFISALDLVVGTFNRYTFLHLALYDVLINHSLVNLTLTIAWISIAFVAFAAANMYLFFSPATYEADQPYYIIVMLFSFVVCLLITNIFTTPIALGVDTIFVALAWNPQVLQKEHPDLWAKMVKIHPPVATALIPPE